MAKKAITKAVRPKLRLPARPIHRNAFIVVQTLTELYEWWGYAKGSVGAFEELLTRIEEKKGISTPFQKRMHGVLLGTRKIKRTLEGAENDLKAAVRTVVGGKPVEGKVVSVRKEKKDA